MARDILGDFGPDRRMGGGRQRDRYPYDGDDGLGSKRDVMGYKPPTGPMGITGNEHPGLGGRNAGNCGSQGMGSHHCSSSGSPGIGGRNHSSGSQGSR